MSVEFIPVWGQVPPELQAELVDLWISHKALNDAGVAAERAKQAVCIARNDEGELVAVGTAFIKVLPRLRQPMYYFRQFFAPCFRGNGQTIPFFNHARQVLQAHNAALPSPESLGVLLELENGMLASHYTLVHVAAGDSTFIGYSPRGLQLRVSYFEGARLFAPPLRRRPSPLP